MKHIVGVLCLFFVSTTAIAQKKYLHCGQLLDVKQEKVFLEQTIVVENTKIISIHDGYISEESISDGEVIDLRTKTVLPGLIDMHVHIETDFSPTYFTNVFTLNPADIAFNSVVNAENILLAGFTTVRDLGGTGVNISLRNAINEGKIIGPRIYTAGRPIGTTGGHADLTDGANYKYQGDPGPKIGIINGADQALKAVRQRYKNHVDWIKIMATAGVITIEGDGGNPQMTSEEIKATTEIAKDYGLQVAAHAHGDQGMQRAILNGVRTIEHGTYMSDSTMTLMKKYDVYLVPTLTAAKEIIKNANTKGFYPEIVKKKALEVGPQILKTFALAHRKEVPIVFGTDSGVFEHGYNAREFEYMVEGGMLPINAIQSATITAAEVLKNDSIGQIKVGAKADIIALEDNPLLNIKILENVYFVMKDGRVYKNNFEKTK